MKRTLLAFAVVVAATGILAPQADAHGRQAFRGRQSFRGRHHVQQVVAVPVVAAPVYAAPVLQLQAAPVYSQQLVAPAAVVAPGCSALFVK